MQGFEAFAQETLLQGFSVPSSARDALQSAEAKLVPPVVRQASDDSGASGDQRVRHHWLSSMSNNKISITTSMHANAGCFFYTTGVSVPSSLLAFEAAGPEAGGA